MADDVDTGDSLSAVLQNAWTEIDAGVGSARHGCHQPVIATVDAHGAPQARTVVLRGSDATDRLLWFHTDARAPKSDEIDGSPQVSWVLYDKERKLQVRAAGPTEVLHDGDRWEASWAGSRLSSRRCYLAPKAPGAKTPGPDANLPEAVTGRVPTEEETLPGRANFAVVLTRGRAMDVLSLAHDGHTRARYVWDDAGTLDATWVAV